MNSSETKVNYLKQYSPEAKVIETHFHLLPQPVQDHLTLEKGYYLDQEYTWICTILYPDQTKDFVTFISKPDRDEEFVQQKGGSAIYVFNIDENGNLAGQARSFLRNTHIDERIFLVNLLVNQPYVERTDTFQGHLRKGLATKRLHILNHFCLELFDTPIRSSWIISPEALKVWEELYLRDLADIIFESPQVGSIFRMKREFKTDKK
jgi:hypothetical protein